MFNRSLLQKFIFMVSMLWIVVACTPQANFGDAIVAGEPTPLPTSIVPTSPIYEVQHGNIIYERTFYGRVSPVVNQSFGFTIEGRVLDVFFSAGDDVLAGDVIAVLDKSDLENDLLDAEEELAIAQSILDTATNQVNIGFQRAQLNLDLAQTLFDFTLSQASEPPTLEDNLAITVKTIQRDLAQLNLDELGTGVNPELSFNVTRAQNYVDELNDLIAQTELIAPMDGRLMSSRINVGDQVVAFSQIAIVADLSAMEVMANVNVDGLRELIEGMSVTFQSSAGAGDVYDGIIRTLPQPYGTGSDDSVHVEFVNLGEEFSPGDRMSLTVVIDERLDVLTLPLSAIRQFAGREFVVVQTDGIQRRVDVQLGLESEDYVEILEGVEENQVVIGQ